MKKALFFKNAQLLAEKLDIVPLMYGSLGLEYLTGEMLNVDDIDILIPKMFLTERWDEFKGTLLDDGYILTDEREHTFQKDDVSYSYASIEELETFADIKVSNLIKQNVCGVEFMTLTIKQYLKVYTTSLKDGYRINIRQKKDQDKIILISKYL